MCCNTFLCATKNDDDFSNYYLMACLCCLVPLGRILPRKESIKAAILLGFPLQFDQPTCDSSMYKSFKVKT